MGDEEQTVDYPETPAGFDSSVNRATNRKRWTSRLWHYGYDEAARAGYDYEDCLKAGRQSSQASSKEFEKLWPKPAKEGKAQAKKDQKAKTKKGENTEQKDEISAASPVPATNKKQTKKKKKGKKCLENSTQANKAKRPSNEVEQEDGNEKDENGTMEACEAAKILIARTSIELLRFHCPEIAELQLPIFKEPVVENWPQLMWGITWEKVLSAASHVHCGNVKRVFDLFLGV